MNSVSCDSVFVKKKFMGALRDNNNYFVGIDYNHNIENTRYQNIIGGNFIKTIIFYKNNNIFFN